MSARAIFASLLAAGGAALVIASACSTTPSTFPGGDLVGPVGLAVTWGQDRDLLFIANTAGDELRALNLCTNLPDGGPLPDGGRDPNTCTSLDSFQFVPGPIRVFPGSILVGNRPARIAGARLLDPNDAQVGAVIVAGAEPALRLVDANNVLGSARHLPGVTPAPPQKVDLPIPAIDVVATDQPAHTVRAFAVTDASGTAATGFTATLIGLDVTVVNGAPQMTPAQHCTLDFVPSRLAIVPGPDDLVTPDGPPRHVYVADGTAKGTAGGTGDGAVEVDVTNVVGAFTDPIAPCPYRRLPASDPADNPRLARPLRSIAISPPFYKAGAPDRVPGGLFLMGATLPNDALCGPPPVVPPPDPSTHVATNPDPSCGAGRIIFVQVNGGATPSQVMRAPRGGATDILNQPPGDPPMQPLRPPFPAREVSFLLPKLNCLDELDNGAFVPRTSGFCTDVTAGSPGSGVVLTPRQIQLGAIAVLDDGSTALLNAGDLRFITDQFDVTSQLLAPALTVSPSLVPSVNPGPEVVQLLFPQDGVYPGSAALTNPCPGGSFGCTTLGVTRTVRWRLVWRGTIPGLETVPGALHKTTPDDPSIPPKFRLDVPAQKSLATAISSPTLQLQAGDHVRLVGFSLPATGAPCTDVATVPRLLDMRISAVTASSVEFEGVPPPSDQSYQGFNPPGACVEALLGAAVEIVSGSPGGEWLVFSGQDLRGRIEQNQQFIALGTRFDYPPVSGDPLPPTGTDIVFAPVGPRPGAANNESNFRESDATFDGTSFTFALGSNDSPTTVRDVTALQGFADGVLVYQNRNVAGGLFYVSLTGTNALLQASPGNLGNQGAVAIYR